MKQLKIGFQYLIPQHLLSRIVGKLAECKIAWFKNWAIKTFIKHYHVNMDEALITAPESFVNFNEFFTRKLKSGARVIDSTASTIISPADGAISEIGQLDEHRLLQAKNHHYSVLDLLGGDQEKAAVFHHGQFATIYLAPKDYHRVHMPVAGKLTEMIHVPGKLFSVNPLTTQHVSELFAKNERVINLFDTEHGKMAVILVGAMIVASISTTWAGVVTPPQQKSICSWLYNDITLEKGAELGHFQLGSTVIILFENNKAQWDKAFTANSVVKMGQVIGDLL